MNTGDYVIHDTLGGGVILNMQGATATVRFNSGQELTVSTGTLGKPLFS